jgi:hypothetical protein
VGFHPSTPQATAETLPKTSRQPSWGKLRTGPLSKQKALKPETVKPALVVLYDPFQASPLFCSQPLNHKTGQLRAKLGNVFLG